MREPNRILMAEDLMATSLLTLRPDQTMLEAIQLLLRHSVSGAPVTDEDGALLGILSEVDCLRMLASDEFFLEHEEECALVSDCMTCGGRTIPPDLGIYAISHYFLTSSIRRLPVVREGKLIGQVSRRDALRGMEETSRKRLVRQRYPDYIQPSESSGPRRARI